MMIAKVFHKFTDMVEILASLGKLMYYKPVIRTMQIDAGTMLAYAFDDCLTKIMDIILYVMNLMHLHSYTPQGAAGAYPYI